MLKKSLLISLMAAIICVIGPMSIPIGPIPVSFTSFVIFIGLYLLGIKGGTLSYLLYLVIGLIGLPVFSGFQGGIGKLLGPTGGYLIGFILMALVAGLFIDKFYDKIYMHIIGMVIGAIICYLFGSLWLSYQAGLSFLGALAVGVLPFIVTDILKIVLAAIIGPKLRKAVGKYYL